MSESNFVDYVKICCRSGKGGAGAVHFYRDKIVAKGGPDGGDGGRGGHIILRGNKQLWTLLHLKYRKHVIATDGEKGSRQLMTGSNGKDEILEVPLGTIVRDAETGKQDAEISFDGEEIILVPGGRGGQGNNHFKSPTRQNPRFAQPGEPGQDKWKIMELKILADVGLVGFPNAGKSTLLSVVSAAKPEIADYPFTTLTPNLGIVRYRNDLSFVMADIPGIIEGAHEGKGLGLRFLRHIERNSALLFLVPCDANDIMKEYSTLLNELKKFNPALLDKKRILGISKCDMMDEELLKELKKDMKKQSRVLKNIPLVYFSSVTGMGKPELIETIWKILSADE